VSPSLRKTIAIARETPASSKGSYPGQPTGLTNFSGFLPWKRLGFILEPTYKPIATAVALQARGLRSRAKMCSAQLWLRFRAFFPCGLGREPARRSSSRKRFADRLLVSLLWSIFAGLPTQAGLIKAGRPEPIEAAELQKSSPDSPRFKEGVASLPNVVLLMVDGVRWQEIFHGPDPIIDSSTNESNIFKNIFPRLDKTAFLSGDHKKGDANTVSNKVMLSLPAYQSIMAGKTTDCRNNFCGRIELETLPERIQRELRLKKTAVATIASWSKISVAVEHLKGRTFVNAGLQPILEGVMNSTTLELNKKQGEDLPPWSARKDEYTFSHALNYLKNNKPRFLFISLNDSDEFAHRGEYPKYISTLKGYDEKIKTLLATLDGMGEYGRATSVIITTDHGRGDAENWTHHGSDNPESKYIWIYGRNPLLTDPKQKAKELSTPSRYTHLDIRPTIETLMGLTPIRCDRCGKLIQELIPDPMLH